ncbi:MAG: polyribonucleotide nucleotidyltransferase, partial [Proteobacteria bacterium]|nr:polyribonucleotide nucleotidyltransferase [Pseudomonadota bacterium]
ELYAEVNERYGASTLETFKISGKNERRLAQREIREQIRAEMGVEGDESEARRKVLGSMHEKLVRTLMRDQVLDDGVRLDGRATDTIRAISVETGVLPRTHGSALFTRGETQALVTCTLGTRQDEQRVDELDEQGWNRFMLHYNFPSYSVGETRRIMGPGRREIGHGALARRAVVPVVPTEDYPYVVRVVSDITESNGSSSMAS